MKTIATDKAPAAIGPYSQAKIAGNLIFTSGQIPLDAATGEISGQDVAAQAHCSIQNLGTILEAAGKFYTQIKIDEITNLGAVKIRLRSLLGAIKEKEAST